MTERGDSTTDTDPRDRAALYACELADASRVLDDAGVPGEPGEPLAHRVQRGLLRAKGDGEELDERDDERRWDVANALGWELAHKSPSWVEIMRGIANLRALATLLPPPTIATVDDLDGLPVGTVLRMLPAVRGMPGVLVERFDTGGEWWAQGDPDPQPDTVLVGAAVLHVPGRTGGGGITREQVVKAVQTVIRSHPAPWTGAAAMLATPVRTVAREIADRLGLTEGDGEGESR